MKTMITARRALVAACVALVASFALVGSAFAATVHGADYHGGGAALESGQVDVLDVDGSAGETVFLTVKNGNRAIARNLPYTVGESAEAGDASTWTGVATLDIAGLDLSKLDGTYTIEAYDKPHATGAPLYQGALYGVYAQLPGGAEKLIGTRTVNETEKAGRAFNPPATLFVDGRSYKLAGDAKGDGALRYPYEEYDEATTVDGSISYVDAEGSVVATTKVPGLAYDEEKEVDVPAIVTANNGDAYRTVFFKESLTMKNPGKTSYSVYCTKMSEADKMLSGYYVATIKMVDENGRVIASDTVNVTGDFTYTAPATIYKKEKNAATGRAEVVTYKIEGSPTINLSAANDGVMNSVRTITVNYSTVPSDAAEVDVSFTLIDGQKNVGEKGRTLKTVADKVTDEKPTATPPEEVTVDGTTYKIVGAPSDYAYTIRSGEVPSINVYYVPEGYVPPGPYEVTVNYVNFVTNTTIESHSFTSSPDDLGAIEIDTPETFSANGVDYVRLDGQEAAIEHSYYSNIVAYTVYYRDKNDTLTSGTVINTIRVVYRDGETTTTPGDTTVTDNGTTDEGTTTTTTTTTVPGETTVIDNGTTTTGLTAVGGTATTTGGAQIGEGNAAGTGNQDLRLNDGRTYNVFDGEGNNGTMTNEAGVDSNTERIEDSETPLASGFDRGGQSSAASVFADMSHILIPLVIAAAVLAIVAFMVVRRRRNNSEKNEA